MLLDGYNELYRNNILHRDIKPENVYLSSRNLEHAVLKLADFGLSREMEPMDMA
jgi:serine/threonine protein kinase